MTPAEAQAAWSAIAPELDQRCVDARPKLASFEARLLLHRARQAVIAAFPAATDPAALHALARDPFAALRYVRGSRFASAPWRKGDRVSHRAYGPGTVDAVHADGSLTVLLATGDSRRFGGINLQRPE